MTISLPSRAPGSPVPSLAELADQIATDELLPVRRRQEIRSALRLIGRAIGRRLEEIPASPRYLRERFTTLTPAMAGVSKGRWNNAWSLVRGALNHAGLATLRARGSEPLAPEWLDLFPYLNERRMREALSRFARYCSALAIVPAAVSDSVANSFLVALEEEAVIRKPRQVHRTMCITWNRAAETVPAWPSVKLTVPHYKQSYSLPWDVFPSSLRHDIAAYFERLSGKDILADLDFRPLRPASIQSYDRLLRAFLSALVRRGHDPQEWTSLRDIVEVERVKSGLRFFLDRATGRRNKQSYNIARMITAIARHWVKVGREHLDQLRAICRRLDPGKGGLTDKNRERLRQFDDPANVDALVTLPQRVLARANRCKTSSRSNALAVQNALLVELLLMNPMRIGNLANLDLEQNILRTRAQGEGVVHLVIPAEHVKNGVAIEAELPAQTVQLLDLYLEHYRPLLLSNPSSYLFPNRSGRPKSRHTLALQIKAFVWRECGLHINAHLFRHIGAALYLSADAGAYGVMKLVLGHTSVETTTRAYSGTESAAALRRFDENVLRLRAQASANPSRRSRRRGWRKT